VPPPLTRANPCLHPSLWLALVQRWKYDALSKRYAVAFKGETVMYRLVSLIDLEFCMLVKGDIEAADLRQTGMPAQPAERCVVKPFIYIAGDGRRTRYARSR
jgi:hypothetical protein